MLIQRRPSCSTTSTFGSAAAGAECPSPRVREARRSRGFGRFGMATSERVVDHRRHVTDSTTIAEALAGSRTGRLFRFDSVDQAAKLSATHIPFASRGVEGHGPLKPRQPLQSLHGWRGTVPIPSRCDWSAPLALRHNAKAKDGEPKEKPRWLWKRSSAKSVARTTRSKPATYVTS